MLVQQRAAVPAQLLDSPAHARDAIDLPDPGTRLRGVGQVLRRRRLVLGTLLFLNAVAYIGIRHVPPRYTAEASLIIGPRQAQVVDLKAVLAGLTGDSEVIESETQVLRSRRIARTVIEQLHLDQDPAFNPELRGPGIATRLAGDARRMLAAALRALPGGLHLDGTARTLEEAASARPGHRDPLALTIDNFLQHLGIAQKARSRVIGVSFDSTSPALSAEVANAVANTYISDQMKAKLDATAHAHEWLSERVGELREQVINADQMVETYRQNAAITQGQNGLLLTEQISKLGDQLVQARVARANAEARLGSVQGGAQGSAWTSGLPEVQGSVAVQALKAQQANLAQLAAEYSRTYGQSYPKVLELRAEIADVNARLQAEIGRASGNLQEDVRVARAREAKLETALAGLRTSNDTTQRSEVELRALQHDADANRALYDRLLARSKETSVESGLQQPDAQIISYADPPETAAFPRPALILPMFFVASCLLTALLVFALEGLDQGFSDVAKVGQTLGYATLGALPLLRSRFGARRAPEAYILEHPTSPYGETLRSLHASLTLPDPDKGPKVVLVASALPGEGKSSLVLALARTVVASGKRAAVIDCDMRHPDLHKTFGVARSPGLADYLAGEQAFGDITRTDNVSSVCLIPSGSWRHLAPDLLSSPAMRELVALLSTRFDLVLLDSAALLPFSDTRHLCRIADQTILVARWQSTPRAAAQAVLRQIVAAGGSVAGVMLSMVDPSCCRQHRMGDDTGRQVALRFSR